ncbi:hypothetical protein DFP72DRAFT_839511 [Ephemerocybe angulata]|uniref:Uncharacterized protein n=1 Tax=Ephemerocybe angulata TaxID=980116 RepID=A0A8H6MDV3_9AGAR|nr:hypothetical protein DFP72DRAFT_839511 [Tulosesus angulatus]
MRGRYEVKWALKLLCRHGLPGAIPAIWGALFAVSHGFEQRCTDSPARIRPAQMGKGKLDTTDAPAKGKRAKLRREPAPELLEAVQNKDEAAPKIVGTTLPGGTSLRARVARAQVQPVLGWTSNGPYSGSTIPWTRVV